ncbi:MAG: nucleotidyltransferase family protein [Candidatus Aenigmatarchaeota archaeon]
MKTKKQDKDISEIRRKILPILKKSGVRKAGIFGSCARGDQKKGSDVDLLVELNRNASLIDFIRLGQTLGDKLKREVDLVEYKAIKPKLKERILSEEIRLL